MSKICRDQMKMEEISHLFKGRLKIHFRHASCLANFSIDFFVSAPFRRNIMLKASQTQNINARIGTRFFSRRSHSMYFIKVENYCKARHKKTSKWKILGQLALSVTLQRTETSYSRAKASLELLLSLIFFCKIFSKRKSKLMSSQGKNLKFFYEGTGLVAHTSTSFYYFSY